ncbi:MAG: hypothetical protein ACTHOR_12935 [Devosia sp.]
MSVKLFQSDTSAAAQLWREYIVLEASGQRKAAGSMLQNFIATLKAEGEADDFAERVCRLLLDGRERDAQELLSLSRRQP